jgi:hypothetical protein
MLRPLQEEHFGIAVVFIAAIKYIMDLTLLLRRCLSLCREFSPRSAELDYRTR